jgi:hypothetical protein
MSGETIDRTAVRVPSGTGFELLERAVEAGGRILRAEGDRSGATLGILALTFDVGRLLVIPSDDGLVVRGAEDRDTLPPELGSLDEEEPWWRLLGHRITAVWPGGVEDGVGARGLGSLMVLKLRFREETENPRVVRIEATGRAMRVSLDPA